MSPSSAQGFSLRVIPGTDFNVLSGQLTGNPNSSISITTTRLRAVMNYTLPGAMRISYLFRILGSTSTINVDADGVTRQGVVLWANVHNACNIYFLSWRTDSRQPAGTSVVEAQSQINPNIVGPINNAQLNSCAGVGYSFLSQPNGTQAKAVSSINIMDGAVHNFTIARLSPVSWRLYTDGALVLTAQDPGAILSVDSNLFALRTDNVMVTLTVQAVYPSGWIRIISH
jgi:hypothetical protein